MVISTRDRTQLFFSGRPAEPFQGFRVLPFIRFLAIQRFQGRCCPFQALATGRRNPDEDLEAPLGQNMPSIPAARHGLDQTVLAQLTALLCEPGAHFDAPEDFSFPNISWMTSFEGLQRRVRRVVRLIEVELGPFQEVTYCTSGAPEVLRE
jgi:hypothetical protein